MCSSNDLKKNRVWPVIILMLIFLSSCSRTSVQDYDNPEFVDVDFHGLNREVIHSITNTGDQLFHVNPVPVIDYYEDETWQELNEEWGTGTISLGAYPIDTKTTVNIIANFSLPNEPGLYRIRHYAWFGEDSDIPDVNDDETFPIIIPFEINE